MKDQMEINRIEKYNNRNSRRKQLGGSGPKRGLEQTKDVSLNSPRLNNREKTEYF